MTSTAKRCGFAAACALLLVGVLWMGDARVEASGPYGAQYCANGTNRIFWFVHLSDTHIGTSGTSDTSRLTWILGAGRSVIKPSFTVATGDLTDSTNGNIFGYPNGPYEAEWDAYHNIVFGSGVLPGEYYDIPGNHDAYNDANFVYYKGHAMHGGEYVTPGGLLSWTKDFASWGGRYHFIGLNTADNTGRPFSVSWPYGDWANLDTWEVAALQADLNRLADSSSPDYAPDITFVFGHHPMVGTGNSQDTYLYAGADALASNLNRAGVEGYNYGHVHDNVEAMFGGDATTGPITPRVRYRRVASLGKSSGNNYSLVAVDCNGVSTVTQPVSTWPLVIVTAPVNYSVGGVPDPGAYTVPTARNNPVRALVFDPKASASVQFRVDGGKTWRTMSRAEAGSSIWQGTWDASRLRAGSHTIEVRAVGTTTRSNTVTVRVQ